MYVGPPQILSLVLEHALAGKGKGTCKLCFVHMFANLDGYELILMAPNWTPKEQPHRNAYEELTADKVHGGIAGPLYLSIPNFFSSL